MMKTRIVGLLIGVLLGSALVLATTKPVHAGYPLTCWYRSDAYNYAYTALAEGYSWGGGWWNNNGYDDTPPSNPTCAHDNSIDKQYSPSCEGPDCSGYTFKSWAMSFTYGNDWPYYSYTDELNNSYNDNEHGPYTAADFRSGCGGACSTFCTGPCGNGAALLQMDAYASSTHVAPIGTTGSGGDYVFEATASPWTYQRVWKTYRTTSGWNGIRRQGWGCHASPAP